MKAITWFPKTGGALTLTSAPYFHRDTFGIAAAPADSRVLSAPYQDGATLVDTRLEPRIIRIAIDIYADTEDALWNARMDLVQALNPKLGIGTLRFQRSDGSQFDISAIANTGPLIESEHNQLLHPAELEFLCPMPLFFDPTEESQTFDPTDEFALSNDGHVPTPIEVTFNGPSESPRIILKSVTPNKFILIERTLVSGEKIVVTTGFGSPSVVRTNTSGEESDASQFFSVQSEFYKLPVGSNTIEYIVASGTGTCVVKYKHWYGGL